MIFVGSGGVASGVGIVYDRAERSPKQCASDGEGIRFWGCGIELAAFEPIASNDTGRLKWAC